MGVRRRALVIGSRYGATGEDGEDRELDFAETYATDFAHAIGEHWAVANGKPLLNPDADAVRAAVRDVVIESAADGSALMIHYIGHGTVATHVTPPAFYLQVRGSSSSPRSTTSVAISQVLSEELAAASRIDGVVLLIDACSSGNLPKAALDHLSSVAGGRLEILSAATGAAYDGCFTRTLTEVIRRGSEGAGDYLHPFSVVRPLASGCTAQAPVHLSYNSGSVNNQGEFDEGLWLAPNPGRVHHALSDRPEAGRIDQLLRDVTLSEAQFEAVFALLDRRGARLRALVGPAGSGKSTLCAALTSPPAALADSVLKVSATVFLDTTSTLEGIAAEVNDQLATAITGFADASRRIAARIEGGDLSPVGLDSWDRLVLLSAAEVLGPNRAPVEIIVDALDQAHPDQRAQIVAGLRRLTSDSRLDRVRVVTTWRTGESLTEELPDALVVEIPAPTSAEISAHTGWASDRTELVSEGGWLTTRLLTALASDVRAESFEHLVELYIHRVTDRLGDDSKQLPRVLTVLGAIGVGPTLPLDVLVAACRELGGTLTNASARTILATLGPLVQRSRAGEVDEHVGFAHDRVRSAVARPGIEGDRAIHSALVILCGEPGRGTAPWVSAYALEGWPSHALAAGDATSAITGLRQLSTITTPIANASRWGARLPRITELLGANHPGSLTARSNLATWRGRAGDPAGAAAAFGELLTDRLRIHGPNHPDTLRTRSNLATWRGEAGDPAGAAAALAELLTDRLRILGPNHPRTLTTRNNIAGYRGEAGDPAGAAAALTELLTDQLRILGPDHPDTLTTRNNIAGWRGQAGDPAGAAAALTELLTDQLQILGPDHPDTLTTRNNIAGYRGQAGEPAGAAADLTELFADQLRILGPDHPRTLSARNNIASWRGRAGDASGATTALTELLADQLRILGPNHPDTLTTRNNIATWRGRAGDPAGAAAALTELLADRLRILGPDHPRTLTTRNNIAGYRGEAGDPAGAAAALTELLADQLRILGPDHPDTLATRSNLASWRGEAGDATGAAAALDQLLADRVRILGPDHPATLATRATRDLWSNRATT